MMTPNPNNIANQLVAVGSSITNDVEIPPRPRPLTDNGLQRTVSDITFEINNKEAIQLPPISEVENAKCECCGMCEECTKEYIKGVRNMFSGRLVCGLCAAAVNEEMEKNGGKREEALKEHVRDCVKFNRLGRLYPVLYQAEAIKEVLKKTSRRKSNNMSRSSSCIPSI